MLPIYYQSYNFASVTNLANFYKGSQPEIPKLKLIVENIKLLFKLPGTCVQVEVAEGERVYKITMIAPGVHKIPIGYFVYIPGERRLDAYSMENPGAPLIQWKQKRVVYSGCPALLDRIGISSLFSNLVNIL